MSRPVSPALNAAFEPLREAMEACGWPETVEGTSYGTPALKVRGKLVARLKDADTLVLRCPLDEKELLVSAAPDIFFETDHYKGWDAVLVRLRRIDAAALRHRLELAWRYQAPRALVQVWDTRRSGSA